MQRNSYFVRFFLFLWIKSKLLKPNIEAFIEAHVEEYFGTKLSFSKILYLKKCFLILRLGAPTGILRGGSPVFKRFGPLNLLTFSGGRAASGDQPDVTVGFSLSFGTQRLPPAMRGSLWPSYAGHCCLDWSDFRKLSMASCRILPAFDLQSSDYARLYLAFLCRSHPPQLPIAVMKALSGFFTTCT